MEYPHESLIGAAAKLPISDPVPFLSFSPVVLLSPGRKVDLQLRVTFPVATAEKANDKLPVVLFSHGHGKSNYLSSHKGYSPVADFFASHGFAVIQPTHLSSRSLGLAMDDHETVRDYFLDSRAADMSRVIDQLDAVEATVPLLQGRLDRSRIAIVGHSLGGLTTLALLGAVNVDPTDGHESRLADPRIRVGVALGPTGTGGADRSENGLKMLPFYDPDFSAMRTPALVVWGADDLSPHLTTRGADWHADGYNLAPGPKDSFRVAGGKHLLGGLSGWDTVESDDESPERLATVLRMTWAYLRSQLYEGDESWEKAKEVIGGLEHLGEVESK